MNTLFGLFSKLADEGIHPKFLCIDVANGYMTDLIKTCHKIRTKFPTVTIMAGNVVTQDGVKDLIVDGTVDVVKVGIGSGSVCTTRKITGVGYPQFSAVMECAEKAHELGCHIISDGGISVPGDISKALCAGADFVMIGSMLGGHDVSPGDVIHENGKMFKLTYGMSSKVANDKYAGGLGHYKAPEGKVVKVPMKGKLTNTLQRIEGGIRSTCTYIGAEEIASMPKLSNFILVNKQYNDSLDRLVVEE
jgi:GMP reductase